MVNVLMLSRWHVHADEYANTVMKQPDAKITCVWDDNVKRGEEWANQLGVDFEPDLEKAVSRADVDAVVIDTPTTDHCRVMLAAAAAGKHIYTEKAMAPTVEECKKIAEAVEKSGIKFCISYPNLTTSFTQYCKQAIDEGWLGKVHYMRMRTGHNGSLMNWLPDYWYNMEDAAGGAMMDLGCHPMYTASHLLGKPKRIASIFNTNFCPAPADDNAVSVVEFENNAIAVLETSFISPYQANCFELLGTEGAIISVDGKIRVRAKKFGDGWFVPDESSLPSPLPFAIRLWLDGIEKGVEIPFGTKKGIALTELLQNAYISHNEGRIVDIK